ncbi:MAG TPA: hypothetical protein VGO57_01285 [Verrucomicrobiae bacterium]
MLNKASKFFVIVVCFVVTCLDGMRENCSEAAIVFPKLPEGCGQITHQDLLDLYKSQSYFFQLFQDCPIEKLTTTPVFKSYNIGYQSILSGEMPPDAVSPLLHDNAFITKFGTNFWDCMMLCGTNMVGMLEVELDSHCRWKITARISSDDPKQPDPLWVAYQKAKSLPQVEKSDYEVRFLRITSITGLWLHGETNDIIIPFPESYRTSWNGYQPYSFNEIYTILQQEFKKMTNNSGVFKK